MKHKILIYAKFPEMVSALVRTLDGHYEIRIAALPGDALQTADFKPDLVCLQTDAHTGADAITLEALQLKPGMLMVPLILLCREISAEGKVEVYKSGITDIFTMPFADEEICIKFNRILQQEQITSERNLYKDQMTRLSQYFSVDVVEKIMSQNGHGKGYGENLEATIFFLDIRNFTSISESLEPNLVASLLNRLYTDIMDLILTYKGSVNKIIGDALLATFGCPVRRATDAQNSVECALAIRETIKIFNETKPGWLHEDISIGMGIATGRVFAGTIGSYRKMDYTVIGDTVNIAARLEGLTKKTRFDLIIDQKTRDLLGENIQVRRMKLNRVRGRTQPMSIYLVDGLTKNADDQPAEIVFFNRPSN